LNAWTAPAVGAARARADADASPASVLGFCATTASEASSEGASAAEDLRFPAIVAARGGMCRRRRNPRPM
jgi:hypothetical protein